MTAWRARAMAALYELAETGDELTSDDLLDKVGPPDYLHEPNGANSAIGSLFRQAAAERWITSTGRVVHSRAPHRKGGMVRVWVGTTQATLFDTTTQPRPIVDTRPL